MIVHETFLDVRYYETDLMGIVHHSNYVRYFECGRIAMLEDIGIPISKIEDEQTSCIGPVTTPIAIIQ